MKLIFSQFAKYSLLLGLYLLIYNSFVFSQNSANEVITLENASNLSQIATVGENRVDTIAWSPDGSLLLTLGPSGLRLYDANDLQSPPRLLIAEPDPRCQWQMDYRRASIQFSADSTIVIAAIGNCIEFWNIETGELLSRYVSEVGTGNLVYHESSNVMAFGNGFPNPVASVFYGVNLNNLGESTRDLYNSTDNLITKAFDFGPISSVGISPDGRFLALSSAWFVPVTDHYTVSSSSEVYLWELGSTPDSDYQVATTEEAYCVLEGHSEQVGRIRFSQSGQLLASASHDKTIRLWNIPECTEAKVFEGHFGPVWDIDFNSDDSELVSAGWDMSLRIWDVNTGTLRLTIPLSGTAPLVVRYSPDNSKIASVGWDNSISIFDAATGTLLQRRSASWGMYWGIDFKPDGSQLASATNDNTIVIWDRIDTYPYLQEAMVIRGHSGAVYDVAYSPDGQYLVSGGGDHTTRVWDAQTGEALAVLNGHESSVYAVDFSPDGTLIASGSWDSTVRLWDAHSFEERAVLQSEEAVYSVVFSPDGGLLAYGDTHVWDIHADTELAYIETGQWWSDMYQSELSHLAFSPDGHLLFNGANTGQLYSINMQTLEEPEWRWDGIPAVSPDGTLLATGILKVSDLETSEALFTSAEDFRTIYNTMHDLSFSPDGRLIISSDASGTLQLWGIPVSW